MDNVAVFAAVVVMDISVVDNVVVAAAAVMYISVVDNVVVMDVPVGDNVCCCCCCCYGYLCCG